MSRSARRVGLLAILLCLLGAAALLFSMGEEAVAPTRIRPPYDFSTDPVPRAGEDAPNVILISIDSLRADHLGCYGYERETSPVIDRIARAGTTFDTAIASTSWTLPSHMSMFTSLYDSIHGVADTERRLAIDHPLLAEVLQAAGYRTAGFYSGPFLHPGYGFAYGFDEYVNCTHDPEMDEVALEDFREGRDELHRLSNLDITNPRIFENVTKWLEKWGQDRFFMFIHCWDVHHDYIPPDPYDRTFDPDYEGDLDVTDFEHNDAIHPNMDPRDLQHLIALYDGEIRWTDEWIGKLMDLLEEREILDRTLVIVTSDHGEEFFEHNRKGHRKNLHDETIRVPLIFRLPGKVRQGRRIPDQVRLIDIYPTILEMAGLGPRKGLLGKSLAPFLDGRETTVPTAYSELTVVPGEAVGQRVLRTRDSKLVRFAATGENIFYDLREDPLELSPVRAASVERGREAMDRMDRDWEALDALRVSLEESAADPTFEPDPELLDRLRSLGYVR